MTPDRFWISIDLGTTWKEVDKGEWIEFEQACGFHGPDVNRPTTVGFISGAVRGHMHYGWMTHGDCDSGPCADGDNNPWPDTYDSED